MNPTTTRPATLHVHADHLAGPHRTDSDDFVHWWAPSVGPSATLLARLLARGVADTGSATWDTADLATRIGLGSSVNRLWATLERLAYFRAVTFVSTDTLTVRVTMPALRPSQLGRHPDADEYRACQDVYA